MSLEMWICSLDVMDLSDFCVTVILASEGVGKYYFLKNNGKMIISFFFLLKKYFLHFHVNENIFK